MDERNNQDQQLINKNVTNYTVIGIVALLLVIGAAYWYSRSTAPAPADELPAADLGQPSDEVITARHQFQDGVHVVAGAVNLPTPCHILSEDVRVAESMPEQVTLAFTATTTAEACIQTIIPVRFKLSFNASETAVISATWNGKPIRLNLVPVPAGENIDDFEVFIKG